MGSNVYYFDYCEEDLPENMDTGILPLKSKKGNQRPSSFSGVTSYLKNRRPPPLIPRQLPRPKLANQKPQLPPRQINTQKECPSQSSHRDSSPGTFRLYSIPEKEEDIHGEPSLKRRTMSEQKPQYSSTEPDISKTKPSSGIQKSDHYGSMPDMSASGGLKIT